jgi:hypothetical protein
MHVLLIVLVYDFDLLHKFLVVLILFNVKTTLKMKILYCSKKQNNESPCCITLINGKGGGLPWPIGRWPGIGDRSRECISTSNQVARRK